MARLISVPFALVVALGLLAYFGPKGKAFNGQDLVRCAYELAELDAPPADYLFVGSSRYGRGFDAAYMQDRIKKESGKDVVIERIALTFPRIPQLRAPVENYLADRGVPKVVFLQLVYNFVPRRHRRWDVPVNSPRNVAYADLSTLLDIRRGARLNDYGSVLPRSFENGYLSLPALLLQKLEANIYAGMRYIPMKLSGRLDRCNGEAIHIQSNQAWYYKELHDEIPFVENKRIYDKATKHSADFTSFAPSTPLRAFEVDQLRKLAAMITDAGSKVVLVYLPIIGDTSITDEEVAEIEATFPEYPFIHPYELFETDIGDNLAKSFADATHASDYGALIYSRFFASEIMKLDP